MLKLFLTTVRRLARGLAAMTGWVPEKDYVVRPWTDAENAEFAEFCSSIGEIPSDPLWAKALEDGPLDFFNNDPWFDMELPRA